MGCNTSKQENSTDNADQENTNHQTDAENHVDGDTKSSSAKTITLRSNGTTKSVEGGEDESKANAIDAEVNPSKSEDQAATKIQAAFRGHKTRQSMKQPEKTNEAAAEPTKEELENEFRSDDKALCNAATKIQASFRGHMSRKQNEKQPEDGTSEEKEGEEELDIDLTDPNLNKAAVKIQATFRGHIARKEIDGEQESSAAAK